MRRFRTTRAGSLAHLVLYPPLAAATDSAGGLVAARALSLIVMLATTATVYVIGNRLFGRLAGALGALVFAVCGLVVHYGAFATFGPLSLFLLVVATWAAIRIRDGSFAWLLACACMIAAANATKYATLAWDPVIIGIIILHGWDEDRRQAIGRAASVAGDRRRARSRADDVRWFNLCARDYRHHDLPVDSLGGTELGDQRAGTRVRPDRRPAAAGHRGRGGEHSHSQAADHDHPP